jgi:hypothetical protein
MRGMCALKDDESVVIDREPDQDTSKNAAASASGVRYAAGLPQNERSRSLNCSLRIFCRSREQEPVRFYRHVTLTM